MTIGELANVVGFKVNQSDVNNVNNTIKSISSTAKKLLGVIGIGFSLTQLNSLAEEFDGIGDRISYAAGEAENLNEIQKQILDSANNCRTAYGTFANEVTALKQANANVFPLGEAATFVEYVNKLGKAAGYSDGEISSMQSSIQRIVASGTAATADITRILRTTPALAEQIAKGLGTDIEGLQQMAASGQITADTLKTAMLNSVDDIDAAFANLNFGVGDALLQIRNKFGFWVDETNKMFNITQSIAKVMVSGFTRVMDVLNRVRNAAVFLSEKLGGMEKVVRLVAIAAAGIFLALNASKITAFLQTALSLLNLGTLKIMAVVAAVILVALLIEDLVNFMQGNDSLIGEFFANGGGDAEAFRETVRSLGDGLRAIIPLVIQFAQTIGKRLMDAVIRILPYFVQFVENVLPVMVDILVAIIEVILDLAEGGLDLVIGLLEMLLPFLMELMGTVLPPILDLLKQIMPVIRQFVNSVGQRLLSTIQKILPRLLELAEKVLPPLLRIFGALVDIVLQLADQALGAVLDILDQILPVLFDIASSLLPPILSLIEALLPLVMEIINAVLPVLIELIETLIPLILEIIEAILPVVIELIEAILPLVTEIIEAVLPVIIILVEALLPLLQVIIDSVLPAIISLIQAIMPVLQPIFDLVSKLISAVLPALTSLLNALKPILDPIAAVLGTIGSVLGTIIDAIAKVVGWVASGLGWVIDLVFGGGSAPSTAGAAAVGASGYAGGTDYSDENFIAGEEGPELVTGRRGSKVFTAIQTGEIFRNLARLSALANAGRVSPSTINTVTNSSSFSRSVSQNVEIKNTFNGDKAIQQKAARAMDKSAGDVTAELARGLAYSR